MAVTLRELEYRETPVINDNFVVVNIAIGTAQPLLTDVNAAVVLVGAGLDPTRTYPSMPIGLLISANTAAVLILTDNGTAADATGINIPIGQSLYLSVGNASLAEIQYTCSAVFSVASFYAE